MAYVIGNFCFLHFCLVTCIYRTGMSSADFPIYLSGRSDIITFKKKYILYCATTYMADPVGGALKQVDQTEGSRPAN